MTSTIQQDFDRIALVSEDGATHNDHYHNYLLRHLPPRIDNALEIGCGTGTFSRLLAHRAKYVVALDLSSEMIRLARERSAAFPNIHFHLADVLKHSLESFIRDRPLEPSSAGPSIPNSPPMLDTAAHSPQEPFRGEPSISNSPPAADTGTHSPQKWFSDDPALSDSHYRPGTLGNSVGARPSTGNGFDCIATIATLHHLAMEEMLLKMRSALNPGGVLSILDLYQPTGLIDQLRNLLAIPTSVALRLIHHHRLLPRRAERDAWTAHAHDDIYLNMREVHTLCAELLPGAKIKKHLLWRYSIVWKKPA